MVKKKTPKRKVKKEKPVIVDESIYLEVAEEEKVSESPAVNEAPITDRHLAKLLTGHPVVFGENYQAALARLVEAGIAADFGKDGHARGHKWRKQ